MVLAVSSVTPGVSPDTSDNFPRTPGVSPWTPRIPLSTPEAFKVLQVLTENSYGTHRRLTVDSQGTLRALRRLQQLSGTFRAPRGGFRDLGDGSGTLGVV